MKIVETDFTHIELRTLAHMESVGMRAPETMLPLETWNKLTRLYFLYGKAPLLSGYGPKGFCIGCGFHHHPNYPNCVWLKDIG